MKTRQFKEKCRLFQKSLEKNMEGAEFWRKVTELYKFYKEVEKCESVGLLWETKKTAKGILIGSTCDPVKIHENYLKIWGNEEPPRDNTVKFKETRRKARQEKWNKYIRIENIILSVA